MDIGVFIKLDIVLGSVFRLTPTKAKIVYQCCCTVFICNDSLIGHVAVLAN